MNDLKKFDDSELNLDTKEFLQDRKNKIAQIVAHDATEIGKQLYLAQQKLAEYRNGGLFANWIASMGLGRTSAYNFINRYKAVQQLNSSEDIQRFEELPKALSYDITKPSAPKEALPAAMNGDIGSHEEYMELKQKLEKERLAKEKAESELQMLKSKPEKIKKVETVPKDYQHLKATEQIAEEAIKKADIMQENLYKVNGEKHQLEIENDKLQSALDLKNGDFESLEKSSHRSFVKRQAQNFLKKYEKNIRYNLGLGIGIDFSELENLKESDKVTTELAEVAEELIQFGEKIENNLPIKNKNTGRSMRQINAEETDIIN